MKIPPESTKPPTTPQDHPKVNLKPKPISDGWTLENMKKVIEHSQEKMKDLAVSGGEFAYGEQFNAAEYLDISHSLEADGEISDPLNGDIISLTDVDAMITLLEKLRAYDAAMLHCKRVLAHHLAKLTTATTRTRRIKGATRQAKIEMPGSYWDQSILREAWERFPHLRDQAMKIQKIGVRLREFKKLASTTSQVPDESDFIEMLRGAESESTASPTIKIEK